MMVGLSLSCFLVSLNFLAALSKDEDQQWIHLKSVRCNISEKYIYKNYSCYAKSFNRSCSTGTIIGAAKLPINEINIEIRLLYKYGVIYREVMHTPRFEWCRLVREGNDNKMIGQLLSIVKDSAPHLIHDCPYTGIFLKHATLKLGSMVSIFPSGDYKMFFDSYDDKGNVMVSVVTVASMITTNKDTFG